MVTACRRLTARVAAISRIVRVNLARRIMINDIEHEWATGDAALALAITVAGIGMFEAVALKILLQAADQTPGAF